MFFGIFDSDPRLPPNYWTQRSKGLAQLEVEIGCGNGSFLINAAAARPETFFLGIDIREQAFRARLESDVLPPNLALFHGDGRWIIANLFADDSVDAFHVYFPDPWWKKRHHKRRLFTPEFCSAVKRCLKPRGRLYLATDVAPRFKEIRELLQAQGLGYEAWQRTSEDTGSGAYERKYRVQGRRLYQAAFVKF